MSVFVTDGDQRATLAVVRALGGAGIKVTVGSSSLQSLAGSSRFCSARVQYASPFRAKAFQTDIMQEMQTGKHAVIFPMADMSTILIAGIRETLEPVVQLPIASEDRIRQVQDKRAVLLAAHNVGIEYPATFMIDANDDLNTLAERLHYPVVLKPRLSWLLRNGEWVSGSVDYASDAEDLRRKYSFAHSLIPNPLVQEQINGEGRGVFLLIWNDELKAAFCHRRLREKPPWGGVSVYSESVPMDHEIVERSYQLLQGFGWQGPAMVEFKKDNRDGRLKLMEVNGRFWGSLQLSTDSGMNFPLLYYRLARGENPPNQFDYEIGVRTRWFFGDLDQLIIRWTHSSRQNSRPRYAPSKLRAFLEFAKFYGRGLHYEVLRFEDPTPGWYECKKYFQRLVRYPSSSLGGS